MMCRYLGSLRLFHLDVGKYQSSCNLTVPNFFFHLELMVVKAVCTALWLSAHCLLLLALFNPSLLCCIITCTEICNSVLLTFRTLEGRVSLECL